MFDENQLVQVQNRGNKKFMKIHAFELGPKSKKKVKCICDECGKEYEPMYSNLLRQSRNRSDGKNLCQTCVQIEKNYNKMMRNFHNVVEKARESCRRKGGKFICFWGEYVGVANSWCLIECPIHGLQKIKLRTLLETNGMCPECGLKQISKKQALSGYKVKEYIDGFNGNNLLNPQDYVNAKTLNLRIKCSCGEIWTTSYDSYRNSNCKRCPKCSRKESSGERAVEDVLNDLHLSFVFQKTFEDCKNIIVLPFDFYVEELNLAIEFDGQYHYYPYYGEETLKATQQRDKIKTKYCQDHNINLLRIPYWEGRHIKELIEKQVKDIVQARE